MNKNKTGTYLLLLVAVFWGLGFITTDFALEYGYQVGEILFYRGMISGLLLLPFTFKKLNKKTLIFASLAGVSVFFGFVFQTLGQKIAGITSSAFYTALYVVITPFIALIIGKTKIKLRNVISLSLSLIGVLFMSVIGKGGFSGFGLGELYLILCAIFFSIQLLFIQMALKDANAVASTAVMELVMGILSFFYMLIMKEKFTKIDVGFLNIIYIALFSTMISSILLFIGAKHVSATKYSIILSLETPFAYLFSRIFQRESFNIYSFIGVMLIFLSVIIVSLDIEKYDLKEYKYLLFDLDNTILNFDRSEKRSFKKTLKLYGIKFSKALYSDYRQENTKLWRQYEEGNILKSDIFDQRLVPIFDKYQIDKDPKEVSYKYLEILSNDIYFLPLAKQTIKRLAKKYQLALISNGQKMVQEGRIKKAYLDKYFKHIYISEVIGYQKPKKEFFDYVLNDLKAHKEEVIVIGDSITSDIKGAIEAGLSSVYVNKKNTDLNVNYQVITIWQIR